MATPRQKRQAAKHLAWGMKRVKRALKVAQRRCEEDSESVTRDTSPARPKRQPFANEHGLVNWAAIAAAGIVASLMAEQVLADSAERKPKGAELCPETR